MISAIVLALLGGIAIGLTRAFNGRLGMSVGAFKASFWNHWTGFLFMSVLLLLFGGFSAQTASAAPLFAYLGGFLGVFFVALNTYVLPRLGVTQTVLLVISSQMLSGVVIDSLRGLSGPLIWQLIGVGLIVLGMYLSLLQRPR